MIRDGGGRVVNNVDVPTYAALNVDGEDALEQVWDHDFSWTTEEFLRGYIDPPVKTLEDIVEFNNENSSIELPPGACPHDTDSPVVQLTI